MNGEVNVAIQLEQKNIDLNELQVAKSAVAAPELGVRILRNYTVWNVSKVYC